MELEFLGRGAALNPKEGNTSAYFIIENDLFIIDCGENIFERILSKNLLENKREINLLITHTHSDHIGSIGSLLTYVYYVKNKKVNIIYKDSKHKNIIIKALKLFGCGENIYNFCNSKEYTNRYSELKTIKYCETDHCDVLVSYSILFKTEKGIILYSGDTRETTLIEKIINSNKLIDKIYVDVTTSDFKGNVHIYIGTLNKIINEKDKKYIYCMHFNNDECIEKAKELGFNIVEIN